MKYNFLIIIFLLFCNSCQQDSVEDAIIRFQAWPSWNDDLIIELNTKSEELTFIKKNRWLYKRNNKKKYSFYELDTSIKKIVKEYGQHEFKIAKKLSSTDFKKLHNALEYLMKYEEQDNGKGLDGISYFMRKIQGDSIQKFTFHTPNPNPKKIETILDIIENNFGENIVVKLILESIRLYIDSAEEYIILSKNPLYIRMLMSYHCGYNDELVSKMPDADSVFIDLINYSGYNDTCLIKVLEEKYPVVHTITPPRIWFYGKYIYKVEELDVY